MTTCLYLDTARLGQMCPEAQRADRHFARLAGEEAGSLYYDLFIRNGFFSLSPNLRRRYAGLSDWSGVPSLKNRIKSVLGLSADRPALLAGRSAELVRIGCRILCDCCENILVTDMLWPAYRRILEQECQRRARKLTTIPTRNAVLRNGIGRNELVERLAEAYWQENCDGLLLSAVSFDGVRMPVAELVASIPRGRRPRFVVLDAAQAVNHAPLNLAAEYCDFVIAGCHKWLRAYHPMGLAFSGRSTADEVLVTTLQDMFNRSEVDDPLLRFCWELENGCCERFSETVNLAPLFTAAAAVARLWRSHRGRYEEFSLQLANSDRASDVTEGTGWVPVRPEGPMRSAILLIQAMHGDTRQAPPETLRFAFRRRGIALSAYGDGLIRISLLPGELPAPRLNQFRSVLRRCA